MKISTCDYIIDSDNADDADPPSSSYEKIFARDKNAWDRVFCAPFLDSERTPMLVRALWLPGEWWRQKASWRNYCLLRNKQHATARESKRWTTLSTQSL